MSGIPGVFDSKSVLIDKLGESSERFQTSNLYYKNTKGLQAHYEIRKLRSELYDFAKNPSLKDDQLGPMKPKQPKLDGFSEEEKAQEMENYRELMKQWETARMALMMQVPIPDMFAIDQYMEPFESTEHTTPAVKGRRFHAFTKDPSEEQKSGLFGMGKGKSQG